MEMNPVSSSRSAQVAEVQSRSAETEQRPRKKPEAQTQVQAEAPRASEGSRGQNIDIRV